MPQAYYLTVIVYNKDNDEVRGFFVGTGSIKVGAFDKTEKEGEIRVSGALQKDTYFKPKKVINIDRKQYGDTYFNKVFAIKRHKNIVYLIMNNKIIYTYEGEYAYNNLNIYGNMFHMNSHITNFSIKQL